MGSERVDIVKRIFRDRRERIKPAVEKTIHSQELLRSIVGYKTGLIWGAQTLYVSEMLDSYVQCGLVECKADEDSRREQMEIFAREHGSPFSEIEEVLDYLGLEV